MARTYDNGFGLGWESADAQHIVVAIDALTEQLRIANLIAYKTQMGRSTGFGSWAPYDAIIEKAILDRKDN